MSEGLHSKEEIYTSFQGKVFRYVLRKVQNVHDAEDLTSRVFVKVYQHLDGFDETRASMSTWIYAIAQNAVTDWYRTNRAPVPLPEELSDSERVEDHLLQEEQLDTLASALQNISVRERDVIILRYYSGHKLKEIAEMMNLSYATIKTVHKTALYHLRHYFEDSPCGK